MKGKDERKGNTERRFSLFRIVHREDEGEKKKKNRDEDGESIVKSCAIGEREGGRKRERLKDGREKESH